MSNVIHMIGWKPDEGSACKLCRIGRPHTLSIHGKILAADLRAELAADCNCDGCAEPSQRSTLELVGQFLLCSQCASTARAAIAAEDARRKPHGGRPAALIPAAPRKPSGGQAFQPDAVL